MTLDLNKLTTYTGKSISVTYYMENEEFVLLDDLKKLLEAERASPAPAVVAEGTGQFRCIDECDAVEHAHKWLTEKSEGSRIVYMQESYQAQAPRMKWMAIFDQNDKLTYAALLTRDLMNWTTLTLVSAAPAAPLVAQAPQKNPHAGTYPKEIWLQVWDSSDGDPATFEEHDSAVHEITWCQDGVYDLDIRYVRADLAHPSPDLQAGQDARDAARYRHLRKDPSMLLHLSNKEFDAAIDAAMNSKEAS